MMKRSSLITEELLTEQGLTKQGSVKGLLRLGGRQLRHFGQGVKGLFQGGPKGIKNWKALGRKSIIPGAGLGTSFLTGNAIGNAGKDELKQQVGTGFWDGLAKLFGRLFTGYYNK